MNIKMKCRICGHRSELLFSAKVLSKYNVKYFQCPSCEFIQTEKPYWLKEAYGNAIADLDVGLVHRNLQYSNGIEKILINNFDQSKAFLDYAGGYGLFVRLMRDKGFNFYRQDKYCENIFAKFHDINDIEIKDKFEALTALELFEHLEDPLEEIKKMITIADSIIFSTELIINSNIKDIKDWWYFVPETGQHIAFYSIKTFMYIAKKFRLNLYTEDNLHILTRKKITESPFKSNDLLGKSKLISLTQKDFQLAKTIVNDSFYSNVDEDSTMQDPEKVSPLLLQLLSLKEENVILDQKYLEVESAYTSSKRELNNAMDRLHQIYNSRSWRILHHYYQIRDKIIPKINALRRILKNILLEIIIKLNPPKKINRQINLKSNKIVYIGHSYHAKTNSTSFLIGYLREHFEVTEILDESWRGKPFPDLSFIDESYLGVVFFQNLPDPQTIAPIKNQNIIFFPMYDNLGNAPLEFWMKYKNLKFINFSHILHKKLLRWGFESKYIQYFPRPLPFVKTKEHIVFFWQRITKISINLVEKLLGNFSTKIHIHKAVDPYQTYIPPSEIQEKKYRISYSNWLSNRIEIQKKIQECDVYIAPRDNEGIGLSFLEAMAMGKAVIAVNSPTMNEYIKNEETGYLFNLRRPKLIDFSNLSEIRKRTYEYMKRGYQNWEKEKGTIIEFIKSI